jgi:hypothetical protein
LVNGKRDDAISVAFGCDRDPRAAFARSTFVDIAPGTIAAGRQEDAGGAGTADGDQSLSRHDRGLQ